MLKTQTEAQRVKLRVRPEPYWAALDHQGWHLGYRRTPTGGSWIARRTVKTGQAHKRTYHALGSDTDLTFTTAATAAVGWFESEAGPSASRLTIADVCSARLTRLYDAGRSYGPAKSRFDCHINPWFGRRRVVDLRTADYEAFLAALELGGNSKIQVWTDLHSALNEARRLHPSLPEQEWREVRKPTGVDAARKVFLKQPEMERLINSAGDSDIRDLLMFVALSGCRPGEAYGALARDVDTETGKWTVAISKVRKNGKAAQVRDLTVQATAIVERRYAGLAPSDPIFARADGRQWDSHIIKKPFRAAAARAKIDPESSMYVLRHSYISAQILGGMPVAMIARNTGTSLQQIDKHYGHFAPSDMRAKLAVNEFQFEAPGSNVVALK